MDLDNELNPPGDDDYVFQQNVPPPVFQQNVPPPVFQPGNGDQQQIPWPFYPFYPGQPYVAFPGQQQHVQAVQQPQPHRVKLGPFWPSKPRTWFTLAESTFQQFYVEDSRMRFNLVLPALSEDMLDRVRAVVDNPEMLADPYAALRARLIEVYQPDVWESYAKLLHFRELGDQKPSQLMDAMLALLPPADQPGGLFKAIFLDRLPSDMRDHVQHRAEAMTCQQLATFADTIWQSRNAKRGGMTAALPTQAQEVEELADTLAAVGLKKKFWPQPKKKGEKKGGQETTLCWKHARFGKKAYECVDKGTCTWQEN